VYGDSPPEWRKNQLMKFAKRVAADVEDLLADDPLPVVLVGNAELTGHFQRVSRLGAQLVGTVETNPEVLTDAELHDAVNPLVQPRLDASRREARDSFATLLGQGDPRAVVDIGDVVRGAFRGQVDQLLLNTGATVGGRYHPASDELMVNAAYAETGQDLLEVATVATLRNGGTVHALTGNEMPESLPVAAILRY
jgi:hypothetical protein